MDVMYEAIVLACDCVNCSRWRNNKLHFMRGTKGKDQWQASQRWYQCFQVKKHQEAKYHARDHVEGTSNLVEYCQVSSPTSVGAGSEKWQFK
jgi:hypothetical protein